MTTTRRCKSGDLERLLMADLKRLDKRTQDAVRQTADFGRLIVYGNAPVAFGDLRDTIESVETERGAAIRSAAPHSAACEVGSRPHTPPLQPLIEWVKLRGAEGADVGSAAIGHPGRVAAQIRALGNGASTPIDAPEAVARAIQQAIKKNGTKPTWFMKKSLPEVYQLLDAFMKSFWGESL